MLLQLLLSTAVLLVLLVTIFNKAFSKGKPTCRHYILNTYLYIALGITLIAIYWLINEQKTILITLSSFIGFIALLLVWFMLMALIRYLPPKYYILTHIIWVFAMYLLASIMFPMYSIAKKFNVLSLGIFLTLAICIIVSLIGYYYKGVFKVNLRMYLLGALVALILGELGAMYLINDLELRRKVMMGLSFFGIIIFGLFLLVFTKELKERSKKCENANYPSESVKFIVSIINILVNIFRVLVLRKIKSGGRRIRM